MSQQDIVKHIYHFLEVLQKCRSAEVSYWDEETLHRALEWAAVSERIYQRAQGRPYASELNEQIEKLGQLPWALGGLTVNLGLLSSATSLIKKALLQNPSLKSTLAGTLLKTYNVSEAAGREHFIKDCYELAAAKSAAHIARALCSKRAHPTSVSQDADARLILKHVSHVLVNMSENNKNRTEAILRKQLDEILADDNGAGLLLASLLIDPESVNSQAYIGQSWIVQMVQEMVSGPNKRSVWSASPDQLAKVAAEHPEFLDVYMQFIEECGTKLHPEYDGDLGKICWRMALPGFMQAITQKQWQQQAQKLPSSSTSTVSVEDLCSHVTALLKVRSDVALKTRSRIQALTCLPRGAIWRHILKKCS